jgi:DNA repair protein RecO (recombination protein O)
MEWSDEGIILGLRRHGEGNAIVELMTAAHGRHLGLVRGGGSRRQAAALQPGNGVQAIWRARLDEHLGTFALEVTAPRAGRLMGAAHSAFALSHIGSLIRMLPERDPHPELHDVLTAMVEHLDEPRLTGMMMARFELMMLSELGFGLDLESCAATGGRNDLLYVSPKSGRAVSRDAGEPWRAQLLNLPYFLVGEVAEPPPPGDVDAAFDLTGHFLARRVFEPRGMPMPESRAALLLALRRTAAQ